MALLVGTCFAAMALVVTAMSKNYEFFLYYVTLVVTPMMLFCGVFFPLDGLPRPLQWAAVFLPLTHAVEIIRPPFFRTTEECSLKSVSAGLR